MFFLQLQENVFLYIVTFTPVWYGDFSPVTEEGRFIASLMAVIGNCVHDLVVGLISVAINSALNHIFGVI